MDVITVSIYHLIKSEDLNHHGTLFAGRSAEWFVESGFIAAARLVSPEQLVCLKIHGMEFTTPVKSGEIICFESKVVLTGRSSMLSYIQVTRDEKLVVDGFITFVNVDQDGKSRPHGIVITPTRIEDIELQRRAQNLPKNK